MLLEDLHCICIGNAAKFIVHNVVQTVEQPLVHISIEEIHLRRCLLHAVADHIFQHGFCQVHVVRQIRKGNFRLNHPEFRRVAGCVGVLGAERRSEGIYTAECLRKRLHINLSGNRQLGCLLEEILCIVNPAFLRFRDIGKIQGCYGEHLAGAFRIGSGNQRRVYIYEVTLLEELMNSIRSQ